MTTVPENGDKFTKLVSYFLMILAVLFVVSLFTSCVNARRCAKFIHPVGSDTVIRDSVVEHIRDTVFIIDADSSSLTALLDCDDSIVYLQQILQYTTGKLAKMPQIRIKNNVIYVKCETDSLQVFFRVRDREVYRSLKTSNVYVKITNQLTGWQWFWVRMGQVFACIIVLIVLYFIGKVVLKKYLPMLK